MQINVALGLPILYCIVIAINYKFKLINNILFYYDIIILLDYANRFIGG